MSEAAAEAFIVFLRCEAIQAQERARSLRATAAAIENQAARTSSTTKRGKKRKQTASATTAETPEPKNSAKPAQTGYTLFVLENYETFKNAAGANTNSKDILETLGRHWNQVTTDQEKRAWQEKADQLKLAAAAATAANDDAAAAAESADAGALPADIFGDLDLPEPPSAGDDWDKKKAARPGLPKEDQEEETAVHV